MDTAHDVVVAQAALALFKLEEFHYFQKLKEKYDVACYFFIDNPNYIRGYSLAGVLCLNIRYPRRIPRSRSHT